MNRLPQPRRRWTRWIANNPLILQSLQALGDALKKQGASGDTLARFDALQAAVKGMDVQSLRTVGWWPDGYDRFTSALSAMQTPA